MLLDRTESDRYGKWQLFTQPTYRKRTILAAMVLAGSQNTGVLVINNYNALLYQSLGLSNSQALLVSAGYNTWGMICNCIGANVSDRFGRRKILSECDLNLFSTIIFNGSDHIISHWVRHDWYNDCSSNSANCEVHRDPVKNVCSCFGSDSLPIRGLV